MRREVELLAQIHAFAAADERIRVVLLNGSRANPAHAPDLLSDYDLHLSVTDVESFARDERWIAAFGEVLLMQKPDNPPGQRAWLIVFADGVRIDFTLSPLELIESDARADSLTLLLLDKDGLCPPLPLPDESSHFARKPTPEQFTESCNEFWWVLVYAAKGLWRGQLSYARYAFDVTVRHELTTLLVWSVAARQGWRFNPGAAAKYLPAALPPARRRAYEATFAGAEPEENWRALYAAAELFDGVATELAATLGYPYDAGEGAASLRLVRAIQASPPDAESLALD